MSKYILLFFCIISFCASAQQKTQQIDVQHYTFDIRLTDANDTLKGNASVAVKFLQNANSFKLNLVKENSKGKGMTVSRVTELGKTLAFVQDSDVLRINTTAKTGSVHVYAISYQGIPADGLIISVNKFGHRTFFGDNWANRAHNWLPCVDNPADKAPVDFIVTAPSHYQVIANGLKVGEKQLPGDMKLTHWQEKAPLPTKVMVIGVADFAVDSLGKVNGVPVYTYVFPESREAGFKNYKYAKEILPYFMSKIGPFAYKKLANVQSKTIYGGMENAGAIFYFENSVDINRGMEELMAHEIAHQWFGDAATEKDFSNLWLSEGFATYMTNLYLENKYGADTLKKRLRDDRATALRFEKRRLTPVVDTTTEKDLTVLLNTNAYKNGGWVLHMLRRKLGDAAFWKGIRTYYARYNGRNANTADLRRAMEQAGGIDLKPFFKEWLNTPGHPQLAITWKYVAEKGVVDINIEQKQNTLFQFPLEISIDGHLFTVAVNGKNTTAQALLKTKPANMIIDPNVNLLAGWDVKEVE
jgi:aminopeptidase N